MNLICEALGAIGGLQHKTLLPLLGDILKLLSEMSKAPNLSTQEIHATVLLCTLVFQTMSGYQWDQNTIKVVDDLCTSNNLWANYRIARAAVRYGHHKVGLNIFNNLTEQVSSEHLHFWLVCLREVCAGEAQLINDNNEPGNIVDRLDSAIIHYNKALAALKAASTPTHHLQFQADYIKIRTEFLHNLLQLIHTCNILCIIPPPAIASTIVQSTRDEYQRHGYITNQIRKCVKDFRACSELYWNLYQTAFDADPATLENIQLLQQMCVLLEQCVESVCVGNSVIRDDPVNFAASNSRLECRHLIDACRSAGRIIYMLNQESPHPIISHRVSFNFFCILE